jgi:hypothetical protein
MSGATGRLQLDAGKWRASAHSGSVSSAGRPAGVTSLYADAVFNPQSATAALVFLFVPLWGLLGGGLIFGAAYWTLTYRKTKDGV